MLNPAYLLLDSLSPRVSDNSSFENYGLKPGQLDWTDDEIEAIRATLKRLTSIRIMNTTDVEDLVQETLLTMISKHPGGDLKKGPMAWSMGILRRKLGNYYRKIQRYAPLNEHNANVQQAMPVASPERQLFQEELRSIVDEALLQIPPFQRQALELMIAGLSAREITEELHPVRYQNVINRLYRGRKKLAETLLKYGYGPDARGARKMKCGRGRKQGDPKQNSPSKPHGLPSSGQ